MTNIEKHRREHALSRSELAARARVTEKTIQNIESGATKNPQMRILRAIAQALNVPVAKLTKRSLKE